MSGDSDKKKKSSSKSEKADAVPSYLGGGVQANFPQAMPRQLEAIAAQLSMGYGAPQATNMAFLENLYSPMNVPMVPVQNTPQAKSTKPSNQIQGQVGRGGLSNLSGWQQRNNDAGRR